MKQTRDSIANIWGERTPYVGDWPVRLDERIVEEPDHWVQSACVLCSNGCGMDIRPLAKVVAGVLWGLRTSDRNTRVSDRYPLTYNESL